MRGATAGSASEPLSLALPVIDPTESAREALRLMREYGRSGVLSNDGDWHLYEAAAVVIALSDDPAVPLNAVPSRRVAATVRTGGTIAELDATGPVRGLGRRRRGVSPGGAGASPAIDRAQAQVLAASPRDCYCRVDLKPVDGGSSGGDCPNGHRGSVRCV